MLARFGSGRRCDLDCTKARLGLADRDRSAPGVRDARTECPLQRRWWLDPVDVLAKGGTFPALKAANQLGFR